MTTTDTLRALGLNPAGPTLGAWGYTSDPPTDWRDQARCADHDTETFFPERDTNAATAAALTAMFCGPCPVRAQCLTHALTQPEDYGIWGGTTAQYRRQLRRRATKDTHA